MKKYFQSLSLFILCVVVLSCNRQLGNAKGGVKDADSVSKFSALAKQLMQTGSENPFSISLTPVRADYYLPALQSFAHASYNGLWIIIGGKVAGFHGTSNNPPPFMSTVANDSMWVIDAVNGKSWGVPVPKQYWNSLAVSNPQSFQVGSTFYLCGGYTVSDASQTRFNTTSNYFFKIDLPSFVQYVQSGGLAPALSEVFPVAMENNFVRVCGGELFVVGDHFYLIGGQDYEGTYAPGATGNYTNAIRSFTLQKNSQGWSIANMDSLLDPVNLHRRDFNLVPYIASDGSPETIILGGVFTPNDLSYNNPVYIRGLENGKPVITVGTSQQNCNQYTSAIVPLLIKQGASMLYALLGGITYMGYDADKGRLEIGDKGIPMPFSNLVDFIVSDGSTSAEYVQMPPRPLLPGYLGSNASFMPLPQYIADGYENILDLNKIFADTARLVNIGFMYGGILSEGPTSGTTPNGHVSTYANPVLYSVYLSFNSGKKK